MISGNPRISNPLVGGTPCLILDNTPEQINHKVYIGKDRKHIELGSNNKSNYNSKAIGSCKFNKINRYDKYL